MKENVSPESSLSVIPILLVTGLVSVPPGPYLSLLNPHWLPRGLVSTAYGGRLSLGGDDRFEGQPAMSSEAGKAHQRALDLSNAVYTGAKGTRKSVCNSKKLESPPTVVCRAGDKS